MREGQIHFVEELIKRYFWKSYKCGDIILLLEKRHHVEISKRSFQRYVNRLRLFRKNLHINSVSLLEDVQQYLQEDGSSHGYRNVQHRLMSRGIQYSKEAVRIALNVLDPEGVSRKKSHRLKRRKYRNKGPNHVWHMDVNDKLKPFGFYVHGCIDGFSRKIIWFHVANTNEDPAVIAYYFLKEAEVINGTATKIRADLGSENSYVYGIQTFFRRNDNDEFFGNRSFQYGKSTSNQRKSRGNQYIKDTPFRSIWTILKIFGIVGNMMILTMFMLTH